LGDAIAAQAQLDLTAAYNAAAGRTVGAIGVAGNLGGQTLTPGLYTSTSSLEISSGDLTLDAQGDPNAVFIFQMASTLVTTVGRQVILTGGAQAANIYWQVGSSATLGTTSIFKGNILALASITVTTGATVEGRLLARTGAVTFDSNIVGLVTPTIAPALTIVSSTVPANAATGVAIDVKIAAVFSEAMDPLTITTGTFTLKQGTAPVAGKVTYIGTTATFNPTANLDPNTTYTATITTGAKNLAGTALASPFVWSFATSPTRDTTRPTITFENPANGATGVAISQKIAVTFSEPMDPRTINKATFTLFQGITPIIGAVTYVGVTATFTPQGNLAPNTIYTVRIKPGAKDLAGNALASSANAFVWSFTTGATPDTTAPTVSFTVPANTATGVAISQKIAATFTEAMDPLTTTTITFTLQQGTTPVIGTVTYAGVTATFSPLSPLAAGTTYTAAITTGTKDLAGNALASTFVWTFTTGATLDTTAPTVSFTVPANSATGVPISQKIAATFSEAMDPLTTTTLTFTLKHGTTPVVGTVIYAGVTATFNPLSPLAASTTYTATITTGTKDLAGNALASTFVWSFTTGVTPDTTAPTVSFTIPGNAATGVAISQKIAATFSEAMDPLTTTTITFGLKQGTTPVAGTVVYVGVTATFTPATVLAPLTTYTATITTGAKDLAGNALVTTYSWIFTTGAIPDTTAPTVSVTVPANGATAVAINHTVNATFSEPMDPYDHHRQLEVDRTRGTAVTGTVGYDVPSKIATFIPTSNLAPNAVYTATLTTGARDLAGNALTASFVWSFTTATSSSGALLAQAPVALGAASTFAVLGASTVTSTGSTTVNGDLGVSPGIAVTGFATVDGGPGIVNGTIYRTTPGPAATAQGALTTAYNDAAGRTVGAVLVAGNLGGQTLTPGLYKSTSSLEISSGDLTLDAQGDANAVFIFQMASTLVTTVGRQVILTGGAQAANVFWQVGSSATLGTSSVFKGNILALASITVTTGAGVEGRLLARTGAVTMDSNIIGLAIPADTTAPTVSSTFPANAATGVAIGGNIATVFSEAMDPAIISTATFTLQQGTTPVAGVVSYTGVTAVFNPTSSLAPNTTYTAAVSTGAKDLAGNALATGFVWSFTTGATPDTTAPTVSSTVPANTAAGVAINQTVNAAFSEAMDPATISTATFTLQQGTTPVAGVVSYAGVTATFTPGVNLTPSTTYTATITTGAKDLAGNALVTTYSWSFTTGATPDTTAPTVSVTVPANAATGVPINQTINATFSEPMDPLTINTASFLLTGPAATAITGTVGYDVPNKIATFNPASDLAPNTVYIATLTTGTKDLAGNPLATTYNWSFTTAATPGGQAPVALGAASTFAVLGASTVTSTGGTTVNGDLGVSPGIAVTGFATVDGGPGIVNGTIYNTTPGPAAIAQGDLTTAYNDAAGRTVGAIGVAGNLGGQTLTPGLYTSASSLEISSGDLTLDAQGDANAVFIFQMASTLTTTTGRQVILSGGAKAANVFWQVGSSATLGTSSVFKGNILALASITVTTGVTLEGRALARTGTVTLDSNTITIPVP
jgi:hypothetical protein